MAMVLDLTPPVAIALLGGASMQILYIIEGLNAPKDRRPDYKSVTYYLGILFNILLSGILGYVYFDEETVMNKVVYFHVGLSAPLILRTLASTLPQVVRPGEN